MQSLKRRGGGGGTPKYAEMSILYDTKRRKNLINGNAKQGLIDYFTIIARPATLSTAAVRTVYFKSFLTRENLCHSTITIFNFNGYAISIRGYFEESLLKA